MWKLNLIQLHLYVCLALEFIDIFCRCVGSDRTIGSCGDDLSEGRIANVPNCIETWYISTHQFVCDQLSGFVGSGIGYQFGPWVRTDKHEDGVERFIIITIMFNIMQRD